MTTATTPGIGIDIVDIARIETALVRWGSHFTDRVLDETERRWCGGHPANVAACLAVKEAAIKALGGRPLPFTWPRIALRSDSVGDGASRADRAPDSLLDVVGAEHPGGGDWTLDGRTLGAAVWWSEDDALLAVATLMHGDDA